MSTKSNLQIEFCGMTLENPFLLASAPPTDNADKIKKAFEMGWAGAVIKTLKPDYMTIENAAPRFTALKDGKTTVGFQNFELVTTLDLGTWTGYIQEIKAEFPTKCLIGSIMADVKKEEWQKLARTVEAAGVDALELNFSCPHGMPERGLGSAIGQDPVLTKAITAWVKEVVNIPVIVKLSPNVTDIVEIANSAFEGGADSIAAINTVGAMTSIDIDTFVPEPNVIGRSAYGGYSGLGIKPIGLKAVSKIAKAIDLPISGMGGITNWTHAVEYILAGSNHVQICTEVMLNGFEIIEPMLKGLDQYMVDKKFKSLEEITGKALDHIGDFEKLDTTGSPKSQVENSICVACKKCVKICRQSAKKAISYCDNQGIVIDKDICDGCSLCTLICPVEAIHIHHYR